MLSLLKFVKFTEVSFDVWKWYTTVQFFNVLISLEISISFEPIRWLLPSGPVPISILIYKKYYE